jgi:murein DD-endopeptidase MepM/ murein hydrolase activator NlpD
VSSSSGNLSASISLLFLLPFFLSLPAACTTASLEENSNDPHSRQTVVPNSGLETQPVHAGLQPSGLEESRVTPTGDLYFTLTPPIARASPYPSPAATTPSPTPQPVFQMCSPLEDHTLDDLLEIVSFPYDPPPEGKDTGHHGVDFAYYRRGDRMSILGVPIHSALPGRVAAVVMNRAPYGYMTIIETPYTKLAPILLDYLDIEPGQSLYLLYAHMDSPPFVEVGEQVGCGWQLGEVGNTPPEWSSAPHLHFEARLGPAGAVFESMAFYTKTAGPDEMEAYRLWRISGEFKLVDPLELLIFGLQQTVN